MNELIDTANEGTYPVLQFEIHSANYTLKYPSDNFTTVNNQPPLSDFTESEIISTNDNYF